MHHVKIEQLVVSYIYLITFEAVHVIFDYIPVIVDLFAGTLLIDQSIKKLCILN